MKYLFFTISLFFALNTVCTSQTYIRQGSNTYSEVLYNWDGKNIRRGSNTYGDILYNVDGKVPIAIMIYIVE